MFGSTVLEVALGLFLIYFVLSLLCSVLNEWIARFLELRSKTLEKGIRSLLGDLKDGTETPVADQFYAHPLIKPLAEEAAKPSYIPARTFALTVVDILSRRLPMVPGKELESLREAVEKLPPSETKRVFLTLIDQAEGSLQKAYAALESWFNDCMDRVSGWYRRKLQLITILLAFLVSLGLNVDTFEIVRRLYHDPILRATALRSAASVIEGSKESSGEPFSKMLGEIDQYLNRASLPLGWSDRAVEGMTTIDWVCKVSGWIFTALALSLGAPFWFDLLNKIANLRSTGKRPEERERSGKSEE